MYYVLAEAQYDWSVRVKVEALKGCETYPKGLVEATGCEICLRGV